MKKAIIFDLYGTLIDIHTDEDTALFWRQMTRLYGYYGAHYKDLKKDYLNTVNIIKDQVPFEYPDIEILQVFKMLYEKKGVKTDESLLEHTASTFRLLSTEHVHLYPGVLDLLTLLKEKNIQIILLSNAQRAFTMNELKLTGILPYFDRLYISSDYKMCKPNPKFYELMLDKENLSAEACLYIGNDHTTDIEGANAVGMESIYLHTNCSQKVLDEFECLHKIIPGDLFKVIELLKKMI